MIKNIVFDLGNVLISFKPARYLEENGYSGESRDLIIKDIFRSREWILLDNGTITVGDAINSISEHSSLSRQEISALFELRIKILSPIPSNINALPALKKQGFRLYFLSNFPGDLFNEVFGKYEFFKLFDGGVISSWVNSSKPDRKIFDLFLAKYSLIAGECLFVDDNEGNAEAASAAGMRGIRYPENSDLQDLIATNLKL